MKTLLIISLIFLFIPDSFAKNVEKKIKKGSSIVTSDQLALPQKETEFSIVPFGSGGQIKMIYDRRMRPQSVYMNDKVYMVYNGGAKMNAGENEKTFPFVISFDHEKELLSNPIQLTDKGSGDQHYCPIIWVDNNDFFQILYGCHSTSGTHLISESKSDIGKSKEDWSTSSQIRHSLSYPTVYNIYDDNKKGVPEKFYNPRYQTKKNLDLKYNLYYVKINLQTNEVKNFGGETVKTSIDLENANTKCKIWDTGWRGAGVPPDIIIDENDNPAFLHVLSENTPEEFNYYYVRYVNKEWKQTVIAPSNHEWNSSYLKLDGNGILHAYVIVGNNKYNTKPGRMDSYGGDIEEWVSTDKGNTWKRNQDLTPKNAEFAGWKFNNIQPIKDPKGNEIQGMLLFYGWKDGEAMEAKAFLLHRKN